MFARGVRVLDLSAFLPGPLASLLLADMGAEVRKVEPPAGDAMTQLGPRDAEGRPLFYEALNAGKSVRRMDLKQKAAREEFLRLVAAFDVLIEGFRPGVMERLGLGYPVLREVNPGLIYCSLSGYGATSPMARQAGHDANYLAAAGVLHRNGTDAPVFYDPPLSDLTGSLFGVIAILGALRAREADGQGCAIDIGLADVAMPLQLFQVAAYGAIGAVPQRRQTYLNGGAAYYQVYATADGRHVALGAAEPKFWRAFCAAAGRPDWIGREAEPLPQTALITDVAALVGTLALAECESRFADPDCCVSPVLDLGEAVASPHHRARGLVSRAPGGALQALFPALVDGVSPPHRPALRQVHEEAGGPCRTTPEPG
ncbi:MAG: CoA transferase [Acetobacteraceae bacterium]|nr:CoA transferase [Acetobacteraceae bacterium]